MFLGLEYFRWFHRRKKVKFQMMSRNISSAAAKLLTKVDVEVGVENTLRIRRFD
jgi:hypothetical protein